MTINCSMVPCSRSRTMASEVKSVVRNCRIIAMRPGIMKLTLFISGLYQTRVWTSTPGKVSRVSPMRSPANSRD